MDGSGSTRARVLAFLLAGLVGVAVAQSVYNIPIQVSDSLDLIISSRQPSSSLVLLRQTSQSSSTTLRPVRNLQARWLGELADAGGWSYHSVFRGVHALLAFGIVCLFAWVARVRAPSDLCSFGIALTVLVGHHTFVAMMREAFPVNHFAEIACGSLLTLGIAQRRATAAGQFVALAILAAGLLLIESAVLLWVVLVGCVAIGLPGLSRRTAAVATAVLVLYLVARSMLGISAPGIGGHDSGWLGTLYSADEIVARFGANPWPFYAYNVVGGALSVVASEPRFGVYRLLSSLDAGTWAPVLAIQLASSLIVSMVILIHARAVMRRPWSSWTEETRMFALAAAVVAVSALLCATYIKEEILSTAGVFYAVAAYLAMHRLFALAGESRLRAAMIAACILIAAPLWGFRTVGTHYELRRTAFVTRNDWVLDAIEPSGEGTSPADRGRFSKLRSEAVRHRATSPSFLPRWGERYWGEDY